MSALQLVQYKSNIQTESLQARAIHSECSTVNQQASPRLWNSPCSVKLPWGTHSKRGPLTPVETGTN
eukprot:scaffold1429_cov110-Cylindrotheca_fusiformis.AAC.11